MAKLTEKELWRLIEDVTWKADHDYDRIGNEWSKLDENIFNQVEEFARRKQAELANKFEAAWLGNDGNGGIGVSDDGWDDLTADVVGRGEEFYNSVTADMLREMADDDDYEENFMYSFNFDCGLTDISGWEEAYEGMPTEVNVGVYFYIDDNGDHIIDVEEMRREFEEKLKELGAKKF